MSVFVLLALSGLTVANYWACRDLRYPPFIMSALWLLALAIYYVIPIQINPISIITILIFIAAIIAFSGGGQLALAFHSRNAGIPAGGSTAVASPSAHPRLKTIFLALSVATLPLIVEKAYEIVSQSGNDIFFIGLRLELQADDSSGYGLLGYAAVLSFFTTFLYTVEPRNGIAERLQFYLSLAISLAYAVLSTGRTTIFFILAVLVGIALMQGRFHFKKFLLSALVFLLSFGFFAVATLKGANPDAPWSENISSIGESLLIYGMGPLPAFDRVVRANEPLSYGQNTFIGPFNVVRRLSGKTRLSPIQEEVDVPFPINVYTGIHPVYRDFGIIGVTFAFGIIGAVSTYFYLKGLSGDRLHIFYYALALFPLLFMTFSDQYFAPIDTWCMYGLAAYLYFRATKRRDQPLALSS
jgi:oligosaccharide repeat unit polymerase